MTNTITDIHDFWFGELASWAQTDRGLVALVVLLYQFSRNIHRRSAQVFGGDARYGVAHRDVIARFGRFPHRNAILGRTSSAAELAYLAQHGAF